MTLNFENVDLSIKSFYDLLPYGDYFSQVVHYESIDYEEKEVIKKYLIDNDLIKNYTDKNDGRYILTSHGENVIKNYGGIEKYNEHLKKQQEEKLRLEKKANDKLHNDAKLSKWQVKTFWPLFGVGLIGFMLSIYNFIDNRETAKDKELQQQTNQQMELELSKLRTLVLDQKKVDSLHNSKTDVDSLSRN